MPERVYNLLFLCTANSARSILAERLVERIGNGRFRGFSAGSQPGGRVHPLVYWVLEKNHYPTDGLRSKSWEEFGQPDSPAMDFVFTVCDKAAAEVCPVWPGQPVSAHWGIPDPAAVEGLDFDKRAAFQRAFDELHHRISILVDLPFERLERLDLERRLGEIGRARLDDA